MFSNLQTAINLTYITGSRFNLVQVIYFNDYNHCWCSCNRSQGSIVAYIGNTSTKSDASNQILKVKTGCTHVWEINMLMSYLVLMRVKKVIMVCYNCNNFGQLFHSLPCIFQYRKNVKYNMMKCNFVQQGCQVVSLYLLRLHTSQLWIVG